MFLGSYIPSFNSTTRRIALPKKIRDYLATSELILSYGFEKCLLGFDTKSWDKEAEKQLDLPLTDERSRSIRRFFFSGAVRIALDDQGRFVIPLALLDYAQIKKPVITGSGDHFEIWDQEAWEGELERLKKEV